MYNFDTYVCASFRLWETFYGSFLAWRRQEICPLLVDESPGFTSNYPQCRLENECV